MIASIKRSDIAVVACSPVPNAPAAGMISWGRPAGPEGGPGSLITSRRRPIRIGAGDFRDERFIDQVRGNGCATPPKSRCNLADRARSQTTWTIFIGRPGREITTRLPAAVFSKSASFAASHSTLTRFCQRTMGKRRPLTPNEAEFEASVIATAIEGSAAVEAGRGSPQGACAWKIALTMRAGVEITAPLAAKREGQTVTARLAANPQIDAGPPPFDSVRCDAPATGAKLREQVGQLVAEGPVNLSLAMSAEAAVEQNAGGPGFRAAGGGAKTSRPFNANLCRQSGRAQLEEKVTGRRFEDRIAAGRLFNNGRCE